MDMRLNTKNRIYIYTLMQYNCKYRRHLNIKIKSKPHKILTFILLWNIKWANLFNDM